jgi:hypothetical protein
VALDISSDIRIKESSAKKKVWIVISSYARRLETLEQSRTNMVIVDHLV